MVERTRHLIERYPKMFDNSREKVLPRWAQDKFHDFRFLLMQEASRVDALQQEIDTMKELWRE